MTKVLMTSTNTYQRNGVTNVILNLYRNINREQFSVDFVAINEPEDDIKNEIHSLGGRITVIERNFAHPFRFIERYRKACKGYDIVHIHGNSATVVLELIGAALAGVKRRIVHSHNTTCNSKTIDKLMRPLFYLLCNGRLACGEMAGKWLFRDREFQVINNGIQTSRFAFDQAARTAIRSELGWENKKIIGHIGHFWGQKNQAFLLELMNRLAVNDDYRLLLLGDGGDRKEMEQRARDMGLSEKVLFAGSIPRVPEYLCAMDLIAMPSLFEGFPLTLVEEQANGLRCIVSDNITTDSDLTGNVQFLSLDQLEKWVDSIQNELNVARDRDLESQKAIENIAAKGYDIQSSAQKLEAYYVNMLQQYR